MQGKVDIVVDIIPARGVKFKWIKKDTLQNTNTQACLNQKEELAGELKKGPNSPLF